MSALVLLHGFTGAPSSWDAVVERLPRDLRIARPALMGHAGAPSTARSFDEEVDRLAEILRSEDLAGAHVVGYSLGARVALGLVARHPAIASRATFLSGSPGLRDEHERFARREADRVRARTLETDGIDAFVDAWEREPIFATQSALPGDVRSAHRARRQSHDPGGLAASLRVLGQGSMPAYELARIQIPITLVVGSEDPKARGHAQRMAESLSDARIVVLRGAGHDLVLERPAEVAALLTDDRGERSETP